MTLAGDETPLWIEYKQGLSGGAQPTRTTCMPERPRPPAQWGGNLDVPLSVITSARSVEHLAEELIDRYTGTNGLVLDATGAALPAAAAAERRFVGLLPDALADEVSTSLDSLDPHHEIDQRLRRIDTEALPGAVSTFIGEVGLIVATDTAAAQPGWWGACRGAVRPGGHVAVVCVTANSTEHTALVTCATGAGMGYAQHLVATSTTALDAAMADAAATDPRFRARPARRRHHDVFVFRAPAEVIR